MGSLVQRLKRNRVAFVILQVLLVTAISGGIFTARYKSNSRVASSRDPLW